MRLFFQPAIGGDRAALQAQSIGRFDSRFGPRSDGGMPALTRRRYLAANGRVGSRTDEI